MPDIDARLNEALRGRYRIERPLGHGGMATVFRAEDLRHDRAVAIKVLHPEITFAVGSERFLREIQVTARLRHPHILPLLDSGEADGLLYYVMPCLDEEDEALTARLNREGQLPVEEAIRITLQVADALEYAHGQGVVHRDIKPGNIMLEADHAVVSDFGIALLDDLPGQRLSGSRGSPGSPVYMSPEQATGDAGADHRSDIYSLGCVLYEMLAGDPPFAGRMARAILTRKLTEPPPSLRSARPSVPEQLEQVVLKALAVSPADRYADVSEFSTALRQAQGATRSTRADGDPFASPGPSGQTRPWSLRRGVVLVGSAIGVLLLVTALGLLSNLAFDLALGVPAEHAPTESNAFVVGIRALVPELFWVLAAYLAWMAIRSATSLILAGARGIPAVDHGLETLASSTRERWGRVWSRMEPKAAADLFFLVALAATVLVLTSFGDLISAIWGEGDAELLGCDHGSLHLSYTFSLTALIVAIGVGGHRLFQALYRRGASGPRIALVRGASLALLLLLFISVTFPWRLLFNKGHPRFTMDGHPAYLIQETEGGLLLYRPDLRTTVEAQRDGPVDLRPLGTNGYLFESRESFDGQDPLC
ncbi:MAG: serine/threonine-protein kinase [Gemmatimonadota bacterium]